MEDAATLIVLTVYALMLLLDVVAPARKFVTVRFWRTKGLLFFVLFTALSVLFPLVWDDWLGEHRLINATGLGTLGGAVVGVLSVQFVSYWWHRALHRVPFLWRWFHQMHHSAERVDVFGAFYFSPLDMLGWIALPSLTLVWALGVKAEAAILNNLLVTLCALLQHSNLRTPRWLGYIVQRPENHAVHHERGVHADNYADVPLVDMLFGTHKNPESWEGEAGFYDGASARIGAMLLGRDVSRGTSP